MVLVGAGSAMNGLLVIFLNGLYCKTRVRGISPAPFQTNLSMKQTTTTHFQMGDSRSINLQHGSIIAADSSDQIVSIYAGVEAINDAVAKLLPCCDRSTQERFMQILTDHIRKVDSIEA